MGVNFTIKALKYLSICFSRKQIIRFAGKKGYENNKENCMRIITNDFKSKIYPAGSLMLYFVQFSKGDFHEMKKVIKN